MSIPLLEVVLGLTLILVLKWIWRRKQDLQKLQKLGYSVPPVSFIGGNLIELFTRYVTDMKVCLSRELLHFWKPCFLVDNRHHPQGRSFFRFSRNFPFSFVDILMKSAELLSCWKFETILFFRHWVYHNLNFPYFNKRNIVAIKYLAFEKQWIMSYLHIFF